MALTNAEYNRILRVLEDRRFTALRTRDRRREEIYGSVPEIRTLDEQLRVQSLKAAEAMRAGDRQAADKLRKWIGTVRKRKQELLLKAEYPADYLEVPYTCPDCGDTGYRDGEKCHCLRTLEKEEAARLSNLSGIAADETFETFRLSVYDDTEELPELGGKTCRQYMQETERFLRQWVRDFRTQHGNLLFMGHTGLGKTFLMNCVAQALLREGEDVLYLTASDFVESIRTSREDEGGRSRMLDMILNCSLLVIDDLGAEFTNSYTNAQLFYVLNHRLVKQRSMIISTNLSLRKIREVYSERISSRILADFDIIPLYGEDLRVRKREAGRSAGGTGLG